MATVTSLTRERILELTSGWDGVAASQAELNSALGQLQLDLEANDAALANLNDVLLPQLQAELDANDILLADLNGNVLPALDLKLDNLDLELTNLNTVVLPQLDAKLTSNTATLNDLNTITLPALQADLDANEAAVANLNTVTLPALQADLDANEAAVGGLQGKFPITAPDISAGAVTANAIFADAVTANAIAAGAITASEISAGAVTASAIFADAVTANAIAAGAITASEISAGAVTATAVAANTLTANEIAAGAITASEIFAGAVTATAIAANTITANEIAAGAITASEIFAGAVTATAIATNTIVANNIAAGAITASEIFAGAVTTTALATNAVVANNINAGAVVAGKIATDAVTANTILAGAISAVKIAAGAIEASHISIGDFTNLITESTDWTSYSGAAVISGGVDATGPYVTITGSNSGNAFAKPGNYEIPVNAGDELYYYGRIYANYDGYTGSGQFYFQWLTGTKTVISSVAGAAVNQGTASYVVRDGVLTAPSNAKYLRVIPYVTPSMRIAMRDWTVRRRVAAVEIVDGAITADKITADAFWGKSYKTNNGYGDIEIIPGTTTTPSRMTFLSNNVLYDDAAPSELSLFESVGPGGSGRNFYTRLTGAKSYNAGATAKPRLDIFTYVSGAFGADVTSSVDLHGGGSGTGAGYVRSFVDGVMRLKVDSSGIVAYGGVFDDGYVGGGTTTATVNNNGRFIRTTSSRRYKKEIRELLLEEAKAALRLQAVTYEPISPDLGSRRLPGFLSEDAHEAGAELWVTYEHDDPIAGRPEGFRYPELTAAHNELIKELYRRIESLEALITTT